MPSSSLVEIEIEVGFEVEVEVWVEVSSNLIYGRSGGWGQFTTFTGGWVVWRFED